MSDTFDKHIDDNERRRVLQAIHVYKVDPSFANLGRLKKYVRSASKDVYIANVMSELSNSLSDIPRYSNFGQIYEAFIEK